MKIKKHLTPWLMWVVPVIFCAFQFVLRLFPGHVQTHLMNDFSIGAGAFGAFSASYYLGYAGFQIPVAILLEKFKPRKVIAISAFSCALGCLILAYTKIWVLAILSRFIIGAGSVTGFLGTTKIVLDWFPSKHHAKMIGISMSIGLLGAVYGGKPISLLIEQFEWRSVLFCLGVIASFIAIMALVMIKESRLNDNVIFKPEKFSWLTQIRSLLTNKMFVTLAVANFLMVGCLEGFADVWGINYLSIAASINVVDASLLTSFIFIGMLLGMPVLSAIADKTNTHLILTAFCGILMAILLSLLLLNPQMFSTFSLKALMISIGILSGYQALVFAIGEQLVPKILSNTAIATLNCINMLGGAFFHEAIGSLIDLTAKLNISNASDGYSLYEYSIGLAVIPIMSVMGGLLLLVYRRLQTNV